MKKNITIVLVVVLIIAGISAYIIQKNTSQKASKKALTLQSSVCPDGTSPRSYNGQVASGTPVNIMLSCDHKEFVITGGVQQVLKSLQLSGKKIETTEGTMTWEDMSLVDTSSGTDVVHLDTDYNFDGYNDLTSIWSNGMGATGINSVLVFLYDTEDSKFVFSAPLSSIQNIKVKSESKTVLSHIGFGADGYIAQTFTWAKDKLYKSAETECSSSRLTDETEQIDSYQLIKKEYSEGGVLTSSSKKKVPFSPAKAPCE